MNYRDRLHRVMVGTFLTGLAALTPASDVQSEDILSELATSEEVERLETKPLADITTPPEGISAQGEYWGLFVEPREAPGKLASWLGNPASQYTLIERQSLLPTSGDFIGVRSLYGDKRDLRYELLVLVPHPRRFLPADAGLIEEFRQIDETSFAPDSSDPVQVGSLDGTLLTKLSGECLLKVPLERHSWLTVRQSKQCEEPELLLTFAKAFFIERLNIKLRM